MSSREELAAQLLEEYRLGVEGSDEDAEYTPLVGDGEGSDSSEEETSDEEGDDEDSDGAAEYVDVEDEAEVDSDSRADGEGTEEIVRLSQRDLARLIMLTQGQGFSECFVPSLHVCLVFVLFLLEDRNLCAQ